MKKLLINCRFTHYPKGISNLKENYALIIEINTEDNIENKIYLKLKEINYNLIDITDLKSFTAQIM